MQYPLRPPPEGYAYREVPYAVKCPVCNGKGSKRTFSHFGETCSECDGAGSIVAMSWETIPISAVSTATGPSRPEHSSRRGGGRVIRWTVFWTVMIAAVFLGWQLLSGNLKSPSPSGGTVTNTVHATPTSLSDLCSLPAVVVQGGCPSSIPTPTPTLTPEPSTAPDPAAGWVQSPPYPLQAGLTAQTALLADNEGSLAVPPYGYPALGDLYPVTAVPSSVPWTPSECNWAMDTLYADQQMDLVDGQSDPSSSSYYQWSAGNWASALAVAQSTCQSDGATDQAAVSAAIMYFGQAAQTHAQAAAAATQGSYLWTWNVSWADAYMELGQLYQQLSQ